MIFNERTVLIRVANEMTITQRRIGFIIRCGAAHLSSVCIEIIISVMPGIGLLNEKPLHASLKQWYARPGDRFEVTVDGFVIDIVRDDLLIEIQTGNFASIKSKLNSLVRYHRVRLVYPIVQEKWIVRSAAHNGKRAVRRKSPKKGRVEDLFWELVSIPQLLLHPNFSLEVLMIRGEEVRRYTEAKRRVRKGWLIEGRRLLDVLEQRSFGQSADWLCFLPDGMELFTTSDLASRMNTGRELAQKMAYCFREARMIELVGKRARANLYRVPAGNQTICLRSNAFDSDAV
jgi:hypothetical protein